MVAQVILDHLVWVRALVPEPILFSSWPRGQVVKTLPSQGEVRGSIPLAATTNLNLNTNVKLDLYLRYIKSSTP